MGTTDWSASNLYRTDGVLCENQSEDRYRDRGMQQWSRRVENLQESDLLQKQHHRKGGNEDRHTCEERRNNHLLRNNPGRRCELERHH
eukprot:16141546-Heterocapsa_arctica.AAC.1